MFYLLLIVWPCVSTLQPVFGPPNWAYVPAFRLPKWALSIKYNSSGPFQKINEIFLDHRTCNTVSRTVPRENEGKTEDFSGVYSEITYIYSLVYLYRE